MSRSFQHHEAEFIRWFGADDPEVAASLTSDRRLQPIEGAVGHIYFRLAGKELREQAHDGKEEPPRWSPFASTPENGSKRAGKPGRYGSDTQSITWRWPKRPSPS
jgi:hypothetical protein